MSARGLVHNATFIFDGSNYDIWKICMLNNFCDMEPNIERILNMGFSPPKALFGTRVLVGISGDNPLEYWVKLLPSPNPHKTLPTIH
jgi:hypothetical protein